MVQRIIGILLILLYATIASAQVTVTVDSPADGATFPSGSSVDVTMTCTGNCGNLRLAINGTTAGLEGKKDNNSNADPFTVTFLAVNNPPLQNMADGTYEIRAVAVTGGQQTIQNVNITVGNGQSDPDGVVITSPLNNATFSSGTSVPVVAEVDIAAGIDHIGLVVNGTTQTNQTTGLTTVETNAAPSFDYTFTPADYPILNSLNAGTYTIKVQAKEEGSSNVFESTHTITINSGGGGAVGGTVAVTRDLTPIVMRGSELTCMNSYNVADIVAFRYENGWQQVAIQIDEVIIADVVKPYGGATCLSDSDLTVPWDVEFYADVNTHVGADPNPIFDANDELVFLAKDLGQQGNGNYTGLGVVSSSVCKVAFTDPLDNTEKYLYFFRQSGSLAQDAGQDYVSYNFQFTNSADNFATVFDETDYIDRYDICGFGTDRDNPETSTISTDYYEISFSDRTYEDGLKIKDNSVAGQDILDMIEATSNLEKSVRNIRTYAEARGNMVNIIDGPIRAIRSHMGTNSGIYNQLIGIYYPHTVQRINPFRVHSGTKPSIYTFADYSANIVPATYSDDNNITPVNIDGTPDNVNTNVPAKWAFIDSDEGKISTIYDYETNLQVGDFFQFQSGSAEMTFDGFYEDKTPNGYALTGTPGTYGASGIVFQTQTGVCHDRRFGTSACSTTPYPESTFKRFDYYLANANQADAEKLRQFYDNPIQKQITSAAADGNASGVNILSPLDGAIFDVGISLQVEADAFDSDLISNIELLVNFDNTTDVSQEIVSFNPSQSPTNTVFFPTVQPNPDQDLSNMQAGSYVITVIATTAQNNTIQSIANVTVVANQVPSQIVTGISNGQVYAAGSNINISVVASDQDGTIDRVELFVNGPLSETKTTAPYDFVVSGLNTGQHVIRVVTTDNDGATDEDIYTINISESATEWKVTENLLLQNLPQSVGKAGYTFGVLPDESYGLFETQSLNGLFDPQNNGRTTAINNYLLGQPLTIFTQGNNWEVNHQKNGITQRLFVNENQIGAEMDAGNGDLFDWTTSYVLGQYTTKFRTINNGSTAQLDLFGSTARLSADDGINSSTIDASASSTTGVRIQTKTGNAANDKVMASQDVSGNVDFESVADLLNLSITAGNTANTFRINASSAGSTVTSNEYSLSSTGQTSGITSVATDNTLTGDGNGTPLSVNEAVLNIVWSQLTGIPQDLLNGDQFLSTHTLNISNNFNEAEFVLSDQNSTELTRLKFFSDVNTTFSNDQGRLRINSRDNQILSRDGDNISISGGNTISLAGIGGSTGGDGMFGNRNGSIWQTWNWRTNVTNPSVMELGNDWRIDAGAGDVFLDLEQSTNNIRMRHERNGIREFIFNDDDDFVMRSGNTSMGSYGFVSLPRFSSTEDYAVAMGAESQFFGTRFFLGFNAVNAQLIANTRNIHDGTAEMGDVMTWIGNDSNGNAIFDLTTIDNGSQADGDGMFGNRNGSSWNTWNWSTNSSNASNMSLFNDFTISSDGNGARELFFSDDNNFAQLRTKQLIGSNQGGVQLNTFSDALDYSVALYNSRNGATRYFGFTSENDLTLETDNVAAGNFSVGDVLKITGLDTKGNVILDVGPANDGGISEDQGNDIQEGTDNGAYYKQLSRVMLQMDYPGVIPVGASISPIRVSLPEVNQFFWKIISFGCAANGTSQTVSGSLTARLRVYTGTAIGNTSVTLGPSVFSNTEPPNEFLDNSAYQIEVTSNTVARPEGMTCTLYLEEDR